MFPDADAALNAFYSAGEVRDDLLFETSIRLLATSEDKNILKYILYYWRECHGVLSVADAIELMQDD
jgi:hypothetical protein